MQRDVLRLLLGGAMVKKSDNHVEFFVKELEVNSGRHPSSHQKRFLSFTKHVSLNAQDAKVSDPTSRSEVVPLGNGGRIPEANVKQFNVAFTGEDIMVSAYLDDDQAKKLKQELSNLAAADLTVTLIDEDCYYVADVFMTPERASSLLTRLKALV
jgi:hypothetical protein